VARSDDVPPWCHPALGVPGCAAHDRGAATAALVAVGTVAIGMYDPILSAPLNLYNVALATLVVLGLLLVVVLVVRGVRRPTPFPSRVYALVAAAGIGLVAVGAAAFALLALAGPVPNLPPWGPFYVLPAALLLGVAVLGVLRPARAGAVLLASSLVLLLVQIGLGMIADAIDSRWAADQISAGATAEAGLFYCGPAALAGLLLVWAGAQRTGSPADSGSPSPA
jgi:hypothetical protein